MVPIITAMSEESVLCGEDISFLVGGIVKILQASVVKPVVAKYLDYNFTRLIYEIFKANYTRLVQVRASCFGGQIGRGQWMNEKEVLPYIGFIRRVESFRLGVLDLEGGDLVVKIPDRAD